MTRKAEDGIGPEGRGYAYSFAERFEVWKEIHNRGYGRAPVQIVVDLTTHEAKKVVHEIRWLPRIPTTTAGSLNLLTERRPESALILVTNGNVGFGGGRAADLH